MNIDHQYDEYNHYHSTTLLDNDSSIDSVESADAATEFAEITEMNYDQELNEEDTTVFSEYFSCDDIRETFPNQLNTLYPILTGTNLKS